MRVRPMITRVQMRIPLALGARLELPAPDDDGMATWEVKEVSLREPRVVVLDLIPDEEVGGE